MAATARTQVHEIDPLGAQVKLSSFIDPPPPTTPSTLPGPTITEASGHCAKSDQNTNDGRRAPNEHHARQGSDMIYDKVVEAVDEAKSKADVGAGAEVSWSEQLGLLVGNEVMTRLTAIDAAAKAGTKISEVAPARQKNYAAASSLDLNACGVVANASAETSTAEVEYGHDDATTGASIVYETGCEPGRLGGDRGVVRIPARRGADKAERAKVHRMVQETFPFVKTSTERGPGDAVIIVCARAEVYPELRKLLSEFDLEALQRLVNRGPNVATGSKENVTLACDADRDHRTKVHRAIAQAFRYLQTKTESDRRHGNASRISIFWKKRHGGAKRKHQRLGAGCDEPRPQDGKRGRGEGGHGREGGGQEARVEALNKGGRLVKFALRKEAREHHRVAAALSTVLRVPLSFLSFAGMKDKIAITTQACVVKGVSPSRILSSNGFIAGVTVGNLSFCDRPLSVGELSGNRFSIVIRDANVSGVVIERAAREASSAGFVNFFGTQRVGAPSVAAQGMPLPYQIGRDMLSGKWEAAAKKILLPRASDPPSVRGALSDLKDGKIGPKECLARVKGKNRLYEEKIVLKGLVRFGNSAHQAALQRIPYTMHTMWVRAYQSHVWNSMASARIRLFGARATPGDLVLDSKDSVWNDDKCLVITSNPATASEDIRAYDQPCGGVSVDEMRECPTVKTPSGGGSRGDGALCSGSKEVVTLLTKEKMEALALEGVTAEHLLRRVVLPLPGRSVQYPSNQIGDLYKQRLDKDGVDALMWLMLDPEKSGGSEGLNKITTPTASMISSCRPGSISEPLVPEAPIAVPREPFESTRSSAPAGSVLAALTSSSTIPRGVYRRLLCAPLDVSWEDAAPWSRSDPCSIATRGETPDNVRYCAGSQRKRQHCVDKGEAGAPEARKCDKGQRTLEDLVISFTLPAGSFATMFLRELMKSDHDITWGGQQTENEADLEENDQVDGGEYE